MDVFTGRFSKIESTIDTFRTSKVGQQSVAQDAGKGTRRFCSLNTLGPSFRSQVSEQQIRQHAKNPANTSLASDSSQQIENPFLRAKFSTQDQSSPNHDVLTSPSAKHNEYECIRLPVSSYPFLRNFGRNPQPSFGDSNPRGQQNDSDKNAWFSSCGISNPLAYVDI